LVRDAFARYLDIQQACAVIQQYANEPHIDKGLRFDAIRMRLVEIGEAAKGLDMEQRLSAPEIPWQLITGMRDHLAHRYWDTAEPIVMNAALNEIPLLLEAVTQLIEKHEADPRQE